MNETWLFAFVILPVSLMGLGYAAVRLHEWDSRRPKR